MIEFLICFVIVSFALGGIMTGYVLSSQKSDFVAASAAAQRVANAQMERLRAARWDRYGGSPTNELGGLVAAGQTSMVVVLDMPMPVTLTSPPVAVLWTHVRSNSSSSLPLLLLRVDCVWTNGGRGPFTNTLISYKAPDS